MIHALNVLLEYINTVKPVCQIYCTFSCGKPLIVYRNVLAFKEWPNNFKLLFQALDLNGFYPSVFDVLNVTQ